MLELKKERSTDYVIGWKSKSLLQSKHFPLHGAFLPDIKHFGNIIGIQFSKTPLAVEQNNYISNIVNAYTTSDLDNMSKFSLRNYTSKNCLFGAINVVTIK